jgi:hypothetical protein
VDQDIDDEEKDGRTEKNIKKTTGNHDVAPGVGGASQRTRRRAENTVEGYLTDMGVETYCQVDTHDRSRELQNFFRLFGET